MILPKDRAGGWSLALNIKIVLKVKSKSLTLGEIAVNGNVFWFI